MLLHKLLFLSLCFLFTHREGNVYCQDGLTTRRMTTPKPHDFCTNYITINNTFLDVSYTDLNNNDSDILYPTWYRYLNTGEGSLAMSCPTGTQCGTTTPVWMNDTIPNYSDGPLFVNTCYKNGSDCCAKKGIARVMNCKTFLVFFLFPHTPPVRWCFDNSLRPLPQLPTTTPTAVTTMTAPGGGLSCLACDGVTHPRLCDVVTTCGPNEVCYTTTVEAHDGVKVYNLGCTDSNQTHVCHDKGSTFQCSECCSTDLCNVGQCGESGYPVKRGPLCYSCQWRLVGEPCNVITFCEEDEVCQYTQERRFSDMTYTSGCKQKHMCDVHNHGPAIMGKRDDADEAEDDLTPGNCLHCCHSDLCNSGCSTLQKAVPVANDCRDVKELGIGTSSGIYTIALPRSHTEIQVYCDLETDGGGWTVFQHRYDGHIDFYRDFSQYENGFGELSGEFWLGLKYIHELSTACDMDLRIDLAKADSTTGYEVFHSFSLSGAPSYTLNLENGTGTIGDQRGMSYHNGKDFYTFDRDNSHGCAKLSHGGWWYEYCNLVNLNGEYLQPGVKSSQYFGRAMCYLDFDQRNSLKSSTMMMRSHSPGGC